MYWFVKRGTDCVCLFVTDTSPRARGTLYRDGQHPWTTQHKRNSLSHDYPWLATIHMCTRGIDFNLLYFESNRERGWEEKNFEGG